ncbi:MAG: Ribosomal RNA small subunit methyltransferase D [candidate division WS6 bacterium OLB20]|uniref:Ribosomal RNA small subunit methyltransferase D n=1 Tax=candidate division WS6 bacterium OLB20 TaxID=1617426 RepID=A0A136LY37_9BACT|nr:MAG: Ribosomal RNA small subunit methyltransferase D [candidate division WS6 bacterium OLB20]
MLRIIAGKHKGILLETPDRSARPLTDRIRTSLFDTLQQYVEGAVILDIFAGSGSFGFEALSRGAESVTFVDSSEDSINTLYANQKKLEERNVRIIRAHADRFLRRDNSQYTIIFTDPPFPMSEDEVNHLLTLMVPRLDPEDGILVVRLPEQKELPQDITGSGVPAECIYSKQYGKSIVGFYRPALSQD